MLIVRSPLRISLAGGGTDLPAYYREHSGAVINTSIDRYFYVFLKTHRSNGLDIASADFRAFFRHRGDYPLSWDGDLELPRAILHHFGITKGVSLFIASEIPPGTGLGSSSSVSVGLIKALATACGLDWTSQEIAELACYIEIGKLGSPIGKQDQYAAACGGLNHIEFEADETRVTHLDINAECRRKLERSVMLFFTGESRNANRILAKQSESSQKKSGPTLEALHRVKSMVPFVRECLETGHIKEFGRLLHENWMEKKKFASGVSNSRIDECYQAALNAGAYGGKITGAGGGGFFMICCEESDREKIASALERKGLIQVNFNFDDQGARVVMNTGLLLTSRLNWEIPETLLSEIA
jgi:D-glycero-alpha-D-manno-heptose-7-phosphate kinase